MLMSHELLLRVASMHQVGRRRTGHVHGARGMWHGARGTGHAHVHHSGSRAPRRHAPQGVGDFGRAEALIREALESLTVPAP